MKVCAEPGCPNLQAEGRCPDHRRAYERGRGTRQARGYNAAHDRLRAEWATQVSTGRVKCWRCHEYIAPDQPWDLGHDDRNRAKYRGPECLTCNRGTATRRLI